MPETTAQTNLSHLHTTVWQFLNRMAEAARWPTPEPLDAIEARHK